MAYLLVLIYSLVPYVLDPAFLPDALLCLTRQPQSDKPIRFSSVEGKESSPFGDHNINNCIITFLATGSSVRRQGDGFGGPVAGAGAEEAPRSDRLRALPGGLRPLPGR